jgi:dTMP kinase
MSKGRFIVLEGLDRSGKSSVVKAIQEFLEKTTGSKTITMNFPDRKT